MAPRITQQQLESYLWGAAVLLRGTIDAGDYKQFIFPLLFYKRLCDVFDEETQTALAESGGDRQFSLFPENHRFQIPPQAHWHEVRQVARDVGRALQTALRAIETANPDKLYSIFGGAQWTNKDRLSDAMLRDLMEHFSTLELTIANLPEDELGQGYEYLIKQFADDSGHTAAEFYTNRTVVHLMAEMLKPQSGESIYDPTCGSGGMLLSSITNLRRQGQEWRNVRLYGQERNLMTSAIARMNCFLHGIEDFRIERGDTLSEPRFVEGDHLRRFDVVLANPPYSVKQWDRDAFASDPWGRNLYGTPPQGRADYAFWQHIVQSLAPKTGRCAILFPHGVLFRREEADMRRKLIEADVIECVLGLGPNLFYNSPMEACVVIRRTAKAKERRRKILFINAVNEVTRERAQSFLTDEHIGRIVKAYQAFKDEAGFAKITSLEEVRVNDYSLKIDLYVPSPPASDSVTSQTNGDLSATLAAWAKSRVQVRDAPSSVLPDAKLPRLTDSRPNPQAAAELLHRFDRSRWVRVRFGDVVQMLKEQVDPQSGEVERYIAGEHMNTEDVHIRHWGTIGDGYLGPAFIRRFRKGQVLYGSRRTYLKKVAMAEFDGVTANTTFVLEAVQGKLLQELLPWLMLSERFTQHSIRESKGSTNPYINFPDIAKFEFALPPLEQQHRIAEILWTVDEVMQGYGSMTQYLQQARSASIEHHFHMGAGDGQVRPFAEVSSISYGITLGGHRAALPEQRAYLRVANVFREIIDICEIKIINCTPDEAERFALANGDVLIVEGHASVEEIGRAAVWRLELPDILHQNHLIRVCCSNSLLPEYLSLYVNSLRGRAYFRSRAKSSSGLKTINSTVAKELPVPQTPRRGQEALLSSVQGFDSALAAERSGETALRKTLSGILNEVIK
jgi:type I restriction enzyme M protein